MYRRIIKRNCLVMFGQQPYSICPVQEKMLGYSFKSQGVVPIDTVELQTVVDLAIITKNSFCMINLLLKFIVLCKGLLQSKICYCFQLCST